MSETDNRIVIAANNNADLYEAVFSAHSIPYRREQHALVGLERPPPYYSSLVTLSGDAVAEQLAEIENLINATPKGVCVKDGFDKLDLLEFDFRELFAAKWLWMDSTDFKSQPGSDWKKISTPSDLFDWEQSWKRCGSQTNKQMFPSSMLQNSDIAFFGLPCEEGFKAGCIANRSPDCVGLSNLYAETTNTTTFQVTAQLVSEFGDGLPVVGYDNGVELDEMIKIGFQEIGDLRIWTN